MPFLPTRNPGVESAWIANSAVMVENAVPIRIARPSRARAPATLSSSDASEVRAAAPPTSPKCMPGRSAMRGSVADQRHEHDRCERRTMKASVATVLALDMVSGISAAASGS